MMDKPRKISDEELDQILERHGKWFRCEKGGAQADLKGADLSGMDLSGVCLLWADLSYADFDFADLTRARLADGSPLVGAV
jgi:hypothetical protein